MRDAESTLDQLIAFCGNKIAEKDVLNVFGLVAHDKIASLTDALIDGDTNVALKTVKELDEVGKDLQRLLADAFAPSQEHAADLEQIDVGTTVALIARDRGDQVRQQRGPHHRLLRAHRIAHRDRLTAAIRRRTAERAAANSARSRVRPAL